MDGNPNSETYVEELITQAVDPIHRRLLGACKGDNRRKSMEDELGRILVEVIKRED